MDRRTVLHAGAVAGLLFAGRAAGQAKTAPPRQGWLPLATFLSVAGDGEAEALDALKRIGEHWHDAYAGMLLDALVVTPRSRVEDAILERLAAASGVRGHGIDALYRWLWSMEPGEYPAFAEYKALIYERIDPRFREHFERSPLHTIRLDEVRWGGVRRDGIPPLKNPKMLRAADAGYLGANDIVFGVALDGDVRAYPKRILAWHEMFKDRIGGREIAGVYCTLCGALIVYEAQAGGVHHELGTSGFLYRSNKLMYDHATKSLWTTLEGAPAIGPLVGKGIELARRHVVTTTWASWRNRHPQTQVLSLDTGHQRNYAEGAAYADYFATDRLMFAVPKLDSRLANKAEVLALRGSGRSPDPLAISAAFLEAHPVYHDKVGGTAFVVLTDPVGANRVYAARDVRFVSWNGEAEAIDRSGRRWSVGEDSLSSPESAPLPRMPAHRAFWFGWYAAYPGTRLVK